MGLVATSIVDGVMSGAKEISSLGAALHTPKVRLVPFSGKPSFFTRVISFFVPARCGWLPFLSFSHLEGGA